MASESIPTWCGKKHCSDWPKFVLYIRAEERLVAACGRHLSVMIHESKNNEVGVVVYPIRYYDEHKKNKEKKSGIQSG